MPDNDLTFQEMAQAVVDAARVGELNEMPYYLRLALYDSVYAAYDWWRYVRKRDVEVVEKDH